MVETPEGKTPCRTPAPGRDGVVNIPTWKFVSVRHAILSEVAEAGPGGLEFKVLADKVRARLSADELERLGSVTWHTTAVKLEMEVAGDLKRLPGVTPQRLVLAEDVDG